MLATLGMCIPEETGVETRGMILAAAEQSLVPCLAEQTDVVDYC